MFAVVILLSLLSAFVNAVAIVMLRRATGVRLPKDLFSKELFIAVAKRKLFMAGVAMQLIGFLIQAVALKYGSIILVEPLLATVLVFIVLILHFRYKIRTSTRDWIAIGMACVGLAMMLIASRPHGETLDFRGVDWIIIALIIIAIIALCLTAMRFAKSANIRAAFGGVAVAVNIGLTAGLTKLVVEQSGHGLIGLLSGWPLYAVVASGISMVVIHQSVYAAGPLIISQPVIEIVNPVVSGIIALVIFNSQISTSLGALSVSVPGLLIAIVGLAMIGSNRRFQQQHLKAPPNTI